MTGKTHISLVAIPEVMVSTLSGIYDVFNSFPSLTFLDDTIPAEAPFAVEVVGMARGPLHVASGVPFEVHRAIDEIERSDVIIVPSILVQDGEWRKDRYPELVAWLAAMHQRGATLCSACSGLFLIAETGLFDGVEATIHWTYPRLFAQTFPTVDLYPEKALIAAGEGARLISSGAATSWHDLVLYLISQMAGPTAAQTVAKFYALQSHHEGLAPYVVFQPPLDHDDATVADVQIWLTTHFSVAKPVDEMVRRSGLPERSFKRRFTKATGHSPIDYVQRLRVEDAKRRLERTAAPIDEIGWRVGYEDPAFFRRLFKRVTGVAPGAYRRKFQVPSGGDARAASHA